ncbi:MAG: hypothetical protein IJO21_03205 [Oscillospiraceae bacterium]|nr:hypothetical protein [Oscillospiraceae bacterium]MBQ7130035.1 hypothetical protein [Oscillospiraceae bacterium]
MLRNTSCRHNAWRYRVIKAYLLEIQSKTLSYRASQIDYKAWAASPEGQAETQRLKDLLRQD